MKQMELLKRLLAFFMERRVEDFHVSNQDWEEFGFKIVHKKD